ncbi:MAG: UDP-N-acetylmuramoyl-L-alanyl-D-glutamate--2,6-diaminopimelate ligase [Candidatus Nanopelagicales bacterium]
MDKEPRPQVPAMTLEDLRAVGPVDGVVIGDGSVPVSGIALDSRQVHVGDAFAALTGHHLHGVAYVAEALANGAGAIITDRMGWQLWQGMDEFDSGIPVLVLDDARPWLGALADAVYGRPTQSLTLLGVTGTNGKTTVASMIEAGLRTANHSVGFIGTTGIRIGDQTIESSRTTPEATTLHALFALMKGQQASDVVMEVSSHAMTESRVAGFTFDVVGFTNLSQDHLDYHGTMEEYFDAKAQLFTPEHANAGVVCVDDEWGRRLVALSPIPITTVSASGEPADWSWKRQPSGSWAVVGPNDEQYAVDLLLPGEFNRANALVAFAMLREIGIAPEAIVEALARVQVPGRLEYVPGGEPMGIRGFVDYAHTPDAIARVITAVRDFTKGRIIVVVGAGGDRDATKRPLMGQMAARLADLVIVTDDNPRSEDPARIRAAVMEGAQAVLSADSGSLIEIAGRREAVVEAVALAAPDDVVLLLGKGHEQGQEINGVLTPFDDRRELREAFLLRTAGGDAQ